MACVAVSLWIFAKLHPRDFQTCTKHIKKCQTVFKHIYIYIYKKYQQMTKSAKTYKKFQKVTHRIKK